MNNQVKVRVRCVVDIPVGTWSEGAEFTALSEQAKREGLNKLRKIMQEHHGAVYGEPKVVFVMCEEQ
jgi:hypothetical protein